MEKQLDGIKVQTARRKRMQRVIIFVSENSSEKLKHSMVNTHWGSRASLSALDSVTMETHPQNIYLYIRSSPSTYLSLLISRGVFLSTCFYAQFSICA